MNSKTEKVRHVFKLIAIANGLFLLSLLIYLNPPASLFQTGLIYSSFLSFIAGAIL